MKAKVAQDFSALREDQPLKALKKAKEEEAFGEMETQYLGYLIANKTPS